LELPKLNVASSILATRSNTSQRFLQHAKLRRSGSARELLSAFILL